MEYPSYKYKPRRKSVNADSSTAKAERPGTLCRKVLNASKLRQAKLQRHQRRRASNSCSSSTSHESDASSVPADVQEEVEEDLLFFSLPSQEFSYLDWNSSLDDVIHREQTTHGGNKVVQLRPSTFSPMNDFDTLSDNSSVDCYSTPEVDALLADDWLVGANSYHNGADFLDFCSNLFCDDETF